MSVALNANWLLWSPTLLCRRVCRANQHSCHFMLWHPLWRHKETENKHKIFESKLHPLWSACAALLLVYGDVCRTKTAICHEICQEALRLNSFYFSSCKVTTLSDSSLNVWIKSVQRVSLCAYGWLQSHARKFAVCAASPTVCVVKYDMTAQSDPTRARMPCRKYHNMCITLKWFFFHLLSMTALAYPFN